MKNLLLCLVLILSIPSFAGVSLKNGNFYIDYTDLVVPGGGHELVISRTYNSRAMDKGWFGFGWGSDFETYLSVEPDGSVVVHENGSGARTRFTPKGSVDPVKAAKKIVNTMRKNGAKLSNNDEKALVKKLANDEELRHAYSKNFHVKSSLPNGSVLYSNVRGMQKVIKTKKGFKRTFNDGKSEYFSDAGKLLKSRDKTGYTVSLTYKNGKVSKIKDSQGKQIFLDWYSTGFVKNVWSVDSKKATYVYKKDDMVKSTDVSGNSYTYSYDSIHNMTQIKYKDGKSRDISYDPKTQFVHVVKKKNGNQVKYDYGQDPKNPDLHYWTTVSRKAKSEKKWRKNKYEYELKNRPDGSTYTYKIVTEVNGFKTATVYSECCGLPLKIQRGKEVTTFDYNSKGLLTKKTSTKGEYVELKYHPKLNKITKVINNNGWTNFSYDKKGNLTKATNDKGKSVLLIYNRKGRITKMVDYNKRTRKKRGLSFRYNSQGKPIEIAMTKVGTIFVSYDNYGEIKRVESKQGHKMALQVTQAFQSLISIVKPAGVNFNM